MKKITLILFFVISFLGTYAQNTTISWPLDRSVFQRNGNAATSTATIYIAGQVGNDCNSAVKYKLTKLDKNGNNTSTIHRNWTLVSAGVGRSFYLNIGSIPTGWYRLEVALFSSTSSMTPITVSISSIKFGVGDVYVIAGQSNARGEDWGEAQTNPYDCVNTQNWWNFCFDDITNFPQLYKMNIGNQIAPHGQTTWCYGQLANKLIDSYGYVVPHVFFNAGESSSTIKEWSNSAIGIVNSNSTHLDGSPLCKTIFPDNTGDIAYYPYRSLRNTLRYYGSIYGVKCVLWHQGEFDNLTSNKTSQTDYKNRLNTLINQSRNHFNSNLNWVIAKVSYNPLASPQTRIEVINAQSLSSANGGVITSNTFSGPNSDVLTGVNRNGGVHFSNTGLVNLGNDWANSIKSSTIQPVTSSTLPPLTIIKNGTSSYTLTAPSNYSAYRWVYYSSNWNSSFAKTQSITAPNTMTVRCYMRNSAGKWVLSQAFSGNPYGCSNARIAASAGLEIYPNPSIDYTNAEIKIPNEGNVRIELLDEQGTVVKIIAEGMHSEGVFQYPIESNYLNEGLYYLRATINGTAITKRLLIETK